MEVCVSCNTSADQLVRKRSGSSTDPLNTTHCNLRNPSLNQVKTCLPQHANIEDVEPKKNEMVNLKRGNEAKYVDKIESTTKGSHKCFSKCASYPPIDVPKSSRDGLYGGEKELKDDRTATVPELNHGESIDHSASPHSPLKLVSSLKGSREKQGMSDKKLSVTWAPDVYDPIPTSVSHVPNNNQNYRRDGKKYWKNKRRGGGKSAGSKNKDKKQPKKKNGSTNKCKPLHDDGGTSGLSEPEANIVDFETHLAVRVF